MRSTTRTLPKALAYMILLSNLFNQNLSANDEEAFCYLPTENNVSYSSVLELPSAQAAAILKYGDDPLQFGELWLPSNQASDPGSSKQPLLVLIHGGCWLSEYNIDHSYALSSALTASGYAVWAIEYRRTGDVGGGWPGSYDDVKAGIEFTQTLDDYSLDLSRVVILGHSAGGHLALLAGSDADLVKSANISGVIGLAAITNIEEYAKGSNDCQAAVPAFMGGLASDKQQEYIAANPAEQKLHPKTFLLHGSEDQIVPLDQATQSGIKLQVIQSAGHFDMIHPATPSFQALLEHLAQTL
ncbi:MAG: acetyl esterase/lipase [Arenicella sp.]